MKRKIESLHGVIEVGRMEDPPPGVCCILKSGDVVLEDGVPTQHMNMEVFVRLAVLPPDLQRAVREALRNLPVPPHMAPETVAELAAQKEKP